MTYFHNETPMAAIPMAPLELVSRLETSLRNEAYPGWPPLNCSHKSAIRHLYTRRTRSCFSSYWNFNDSMAFTPLVCLEVVLRGNVDTAYSTSSKDGAMMSNFLAGNWKISAQVCSEPWPCEIEQCYIARPQSCFPQVQKHKAQELAHDWTNWPFGARNFLFWKLRVIAWSTSSNNNDRLGNLAVLRP